MRTLPFLAFLLTTAICLAQGQPLEHSFGGTCTVPDAANKTPIRLQLWQHDYRRDSATIVADVRAAADGTYRFERAPWLAGHDWGFMFFMLHAQQGPNVAVVQLRGDDAARAAVDLTLRPAVTIRGRVAAEDGKPVAGAEVSVRMCGGGFFASTPPSLVARSDAAGEFELRGVPPGGLRMHCLAAPFALAMLNGYAEDEWHFTLQPGAVLAGRVLREDGKPAVRMRVCAQGQTKHAWTTTSTDDEGRYRLLGLVDDRYNVWIDADDVTCAALDGQTVELGATTDAPDLIAVAGGSFVGRVVDADTGEGVRPGDSADVAIYGPSRPRSGAGCDVEPIAADGTFRIRVAPGSNYIYLRADEAKFTPVGDSSFTLPVLAGGEVKVEFKVRRAKSK